MNQTITINQVLGFNNTDYEFLNQCIDDCLDLYKPLYDTGYATFIDKYGTFIKNKLKLSIKAIGNFESLYDLDTSQDLILKLTNDKIQELFTKAINSKLMFDNNWDDFINLGGNESSGSSTSGYEGYDVSNQEGNYQTNKSNAKSTGGTSRLQYIQFLNDTINNFVEIYVKDMVKLVCRIIY